MKRENEFIKALEPITDNILMQKSKTFVQHGNISVYTHSVAVAKYSVSLAEFLHIKYDFNSLVRGAALHDFFLYDWHKINNVGDGLHGFAHPKTAARNASNSFALNKKEYDIIRKHMWPLTLLNIPTCRESWLVCAVDKYCSTLETLKINKYNNETFEYKKRPHIT